jgi:heavy metal sensor kinase
MSSVLRRLRPRSLRARLLVWYSVVFFVCSLALVLLIYLFADHYLRASANAFLNDETEEFVRQANARMPDIADLRGYMNLEIGKNRYFLPFYRMYDAATAEVLLALPEPTPSVPLNEAAVQRGGQGRRFVETVRTHDPEGDVYRVETLPLQKDGHLLLLQCGFLQSKLHEPLDRLKAYLALSIVVTVLAAVGGGWFLAGRSLKPMADIVRSLRQTRSTDLSRRLPARPVADEMGALTDAINSMLDELEQAFYRTQAFTADVAHELRTPLATLRCELELTEGRPRGTDEYRQVVESALEQTRKLARIIDNLLFLAKTDAAAALPERASVDLAALLGDLAESFELLAEAKGIGVSVDISPGLHLWGNAEWLRILFSNLLDNAVKYTQPGGRVSLRARLQDGSLLVGVEDSGAGIAEEDLERVFDRFYRADRSRSRDTGGAGLGLSIARRIAELHGGRITVRSRQGEGSVFEVVLPAGDA